MTILRAFLADRELDTEKRASLSDFCDMLGAAAAAVPTHHAHLRKVRRRQQRQADKTASLGKEVARAALPAAVATAIGLGTLAAGQGLRKLHNKATFNRDLNQVLEAYPSIREDYPDREIKMVYQSIRHLNPHVAKDPLAAGTTMRHVLRERHMDDRSIRFDLPLAESLQRTAPRGSTVADELAARGMMGGTQAGLSARSSELDSLAARDFQRAQKELDRELQRELLREKLRDAQAARNARTPPKPNLGHLGRKP